MMYTSRSRQFAWSCTCRQSLAKRVFRTGLRHGQLRADLVGQLRMGGPAESRSPAQQGQAAVRLLRSPDEDDPAVPAYAYPESAARALGHAARYGTWQATPPGRVPDLEGLRPDRARELIAGLLADAPAGGWLPPDPAVELLGCYGVPLVDCITVTTEDTVIAAAARFGGPVALKADVPGLVRRRDARAVLCLTSRERMRSGAGSARCRRPSVTGWPALSSSR